MCFPMFGDPLFEELFVFESLWVLLKSPELIFFSACVQYCVFLTFFSPTWSYFSLNNFKQHELTPGNILT